MVPALVAGTIASLAITTVLLWLQEPHTVADIVAGYAVDGLMWTVVLGGIGVLIKRDSPRNLLGPLFAGIGIWFGLGGVAGALQPLLDPTSLGFALCAVTNGMWMLVVPALFLVPHLYPDGRPMSSRWRTPARIGAACVGVVAVCGLVSPEITETDDGVGSGRQSLRRRGPRTRAAGLERPRPVRPRRAGGPGPPRRGRRACPRRVAARVLRAHARSGSSTPCARWPRASSCSDWTSPRTSWRSSQRPEAHVSSPRSPS
jgi:hypothetical protein